MDEKDLVDALKDLRQRRGASHARVAYSPIRPLLSGDGHPRDQLMELCRQLGDSPQAKALWVAFGFEPGSSAKLTDRRLNYSLAVSTTSPPDPKTIERWENQMLVELAHLIMVNAPERPAETVTADEELLIKLADWSEQELAVLELKVGMSDALGEPQPPSLDSWADDWMQRWARSAGDLTAEQRALVREVFEQLTAAGDRTERTAVVLGRLRAILEVQLLLGLRSQDDEADLDERYPHWRNIVDGYGG